MGLEVLDSEKIKERIKKKQDIVTLKEVLKETGVEAYKSQEKMKEKLPKCMKLMVLETIKIRKQ